MKTIPMLGILGVCTLVYLGWFLQNWKQRLDIKMNGLIKYKNKNINLNNIFYVNYYSSNIMYTTADGGSSSDLYRIIFYTVNKSNIIWGFKNIEEGKKVYEHILNFNFINIEKEIKINE